MYKIAKLKFGYQFTFAEEISPEEMKRWQDEARAALSEAPASFGVLVDMRALKPGGIGPAAQAIMVEGQSLFRKAGMERSCVILQSATVTMQFEHIAGESGISSFERYINAARTPDWQTKAAAWIENKIDPNAEPCVSGARSGRNSGGHQR